jgi:hypothetical protein
LPLDARKQLGVAIEHLLAAPNGRRGDARAGVALEAPLEGAALAAVEGCRIGATPESALPMTACETPPAAASREIAATKARKSPPHCAASDGVANRSGT